MSSVKTISYSMVIETSDFLHRIEANQFNLFTQKLHNGIYNLLAKFKGTIIKHNDNTYEVTFNSVTNAVLCALKLQSNFKYITPKFDKSIRDLKLGITKGTSKKSKILATRMCEIVVNDKFVISEEVKVKNKGVFISPYNTEYDNILVVGPIAGKTHQELIFPILSPDPEKNSNVKYLTYPVYGGGNRGRGQVYPTGEKSNLNIFGAIADGQISEIKTSEKGEYTLTILGLTGEKTSQTIPAGLTLNVKQGDFVKIDSPLNIDPNKGGFGQEETEIVLQNPSRIVGYLAFCFFVLLTQIFLILKKKQFEKVQATELNF